MNMVDKGFANFIVANRVGSTRSAIKAFRVVEWATFIGLWIVVSQARYGATSMFGVEDLRVSLYDVAIHQEDGVDTCWTQSVGLDLLPDIPHIWLGAARLLVVISLGKRDRNSWFFQSTKNVQLLPLIRK
ncbi:hypothetical protein DVB73_08035 [Pseudomonas plecoglossicida]|uniref:Uncharacterized protein n=1 Tax=Pseudomonas plecoglossicida TaxID=70775 RepID=A0AAD0R0F8_PSEDL|nr:hypothetical protein DVB73_08035 [Pseudomonas plecoglossicida]EPB97385.1 hypothetical protein L321_03252 [Pseudomonas plecoglossicida NB2011]